MSSESEASRRHRLELVGTVISAGSPQTVVVTVERRVQHPQYQRYVNRSKRYMAHDARGACKLGDEVLISECRPLSKRKRWQVSRILKSAAGA